MFFGDDYYGKVDWVPGLFYVRTRFLHVWWFPLIPRESYLFLEQPDAAGNPVALPIPLRWQSVWFAWLRACVALLIVFFLFAGTAIWEDPYQSAKAHGIVMAVTWLIAAALGYVYFLLWRRSAATLSRAIELGLLLGLRPEQFAISKAGDVSLDPIHPGYNRRAT